MRARHLQNFLGFGQPPARFFAIEDFFVAVAAFLAGAFFVAVGFFVSVGFAAEGLRGLTEAFSFSMWSSRCSRS